MSRSISLALIACRWARLASAESIGGSAREPCRSASTSSRVASSICGSMDLSSTRATPQASANGAASSGR
jgi:hypothetical protein